MDWSDEFLMTFPYLEGHYLINIIKMYANSTTKGNPSQNNLTPPLLLQKRGRKWSDTLLKNSNLFIKTC